MFSEFLIWAAIALSAGGLMFAVMYVAIKTFESAASFFKLMDSHEKGQ